MASPDYVCEKILVAIESIATGDGSFEDRLFDAYVSALMRLQASDASVDYADSLSWILYFCEHQLKPGGSGMRPVALEDRGKLVREMLKVAFAVN